MAQKTQTQNPTAVRMTDYLTTGIDDPELARFAVTVSRRDGSKAVAFDHLTGALYL